MNKKIRPSLLLAHLMIGLSFVYRKHIDTSIIEIAYVKPGIVQLILHNNDYLILEDEIRQML